jgi:hypothetical protein
VGSPPPANPAATGKDPGRQGGAGPGAARDRQAAGEGRKKWERDYCNATKLADLPCVVQEELYQIAIKKLPNVALAWLKRTYRVQTSLGELLEWSNWFPLSRPLQRARVHVDMMEAVKKSHPQIERDAKKVARAGQIAFEQAAIEQKNLTQYLQLRKMRLKEEAQALTARRVKLLEKKAAQAEAAEKATRDETLTPEERDQKIKEIFGIK